MTETKGERTKNQLLEITLKLIADHGFDALTYDRVAMEAGVSRQLVQKYFPDRSAWLIQAFQSATESLVQAIERALAVPARAQDRFERYLRAHFEWARTNGKSRAFLPFLGLAAVQSGALEENSRTNRLGWVRIQFLLREIELNQAVAPTSESTLERQASGVQAALTGHLILALTDRRCRARDYEDLAVSLILQSFNCPETDPPRTPKSRPKPLSRVRSHPRRRRSPF